MANENTQKRLVTIDDDDHLQVLIHLGRIKAIADSICSLDRQNYIDGLFPHTLKNLTETIDSEVDAAKALLTKDSSEGGES